MRFVCIILPALLALKIQMYKRRECRVINLVLSGAVWNLIINALTMIIMTYVVRSSPEPYVGQLDYFRTALQYLGIVSGLAIVMALLYESLKRYFESSSCCCSTK